ncbi:hypothetical protein LIA77_01686 [Sarocladium implicatum]|nr:hypothetical protein LIA77_01686 [Sarocladium implicatum]
MRPAGGRRMRCKSAVSGGVDCAPGREAASEAKIKGQATLTSVGCAQFVEGRGPGESRSQGFSSPSNQLAHTSRGTHREPLAREGWSDRRVESGDHPLAVCITGRGLGVLWRAIALVRIPQPAGNEEEGTELWATRDHSATRHQGIQHCAEYVVSFAPAILATGPANVTRAPSVAYASNQRFRTVDPDGISQFHFLHGTARALRIASQAKSARGPRG